MAASPSYGSTLSIGGTIAGVRSIDGPQMSREMIDITALADPHKVKIPARPNGGTVTAEILLESAHHGSADDWLGAGITTTDVPSPIACVVTFPSGSFSFDAFVTGFAPKASNDEALTATITLEVTGPVTCAGAS
jgi:hypothetical protein